MYYVCCVPVGLVSPVFLGVCVNFGQRLTTFRTSFRVSTHFGKFDKLMVELEDGEKCNISA